MRNGTYGLSQALPSTSRVSGPSIASLGQQDLSSSRSLASAAAGQEAARASANANMDQESKAGVAQLGSVAGGVIGSVYGGPAGALLGSTLGGALGSLANNLF